MEIKEFQVKKLFEENKDLNEKLVEKDARYYRLAEFCEQMKAEYEQKIKELTEENKAWQAQLISQKEKADKAYYDLACEVEDLRAENERLRTSYETVAKLWAKSKADTVRKMQSEIEARCIKGGIYPAFVKGTVDQIAKEMIEGETK